MKNPRIIFISDTHRDHRSVKVPDGDILVHCGDITARGEIESLISFNKWLTELPHKHKIIIAGNHDFSAENQGSLWSEILSEHIYLLDQTAEVEGIKFYGSPYQPWFHNWAFNLERGEPLRRKWTMIPDDTDVLITHGPPLNILDLTQRDRLHVGCEELLKRVKQISPKIHAFGHIHESYGVYEEGQTIFINASICTLEYQPINLPIVYDWNDGRPSRVI
jgi:Icc-related predicted phosphoesterase